jgi:hypothetical protein
MERIMESSQQDNGKSLFKNMRTRVRRSVYLKFKQHAEKESKRRGMCVSVADLVREAMNDYLNNKINS